jgi:hypothetical protein
MSQLTDFYSGEGRDTEGRTLDAVLGMDDEDMEIEHDYIQWLFPLREHSRFNADAPILTDEDIAAFNADKVMKYRLLKAFHRFLNFLGLEYHEDEFGKGLWRVKKADNFAARRPEVWNRPNHNWLRITRCLTSLRLLGMRDECAAFFDFLKNLHDREALVTDDTFRYWQSAVEE